MSLADCVLSEDKGRQALGDVKKVAEEGGQKRAKGEKKVNTINENYDIAVIGGGMAGLCAAIAAAREGSRTVLFHDRPVLGGNASSEIRMHICGADYHASRANARETGIIEEILLEHKHRNPENSFAIFDAILWEKAAFQENLTLRLNTRVTDLITEQQKISEIKAVQMTTEKTLLISADIVVDATGDGFVAKLAGADTTLGREGKEVYGESYAPDETDCCTMGNSLMFKARDMGHPVTFIRPFWADQYTEEDMKNRSHKEISSGYWWIELGGGTQDVIADGEEIRDELLKAMYGVWDHIKNGGDHGAENYELEWVGFLPGKRESRRILGDYVLKQQDCQSGGRFEDTVAYGGWPMDVHVIEGFRRKNEKANVFLKLDDVYGIPYRSYYSRNIDNLMMAGRDISCSHMAFASTRVMATCAVGGQAVGVAASMAVKAKELPREVGKRIGELQQKLLRQDCYLPGIPNCDEADKARSATVSASSFVCAAEPENVINGWGRTIGDRNNFWQPEEESEPWISLKFPEAVSAKEIQLLFDSNLSREIMISLSDKKLAKQEKGTPSDLVKDFRLIFMKDGDVVAEKRIDGNYQRRCQVVLDTEITRDSVRLEILSTHGTKQPKLFEIRVY